MRAAVSATEMSGSLPMSSATTESMICGAVRLMLSADFRLARMPVTTISGPASVSAPVGAVVVELGVPPGPCPAGTAWADDAGRGDQRHGSR